MTRAQPFVPTGRALASASPACRAAAAEPAEGPSTELSLKQLSASVWQAKASTSVLLNAGQQKGRRKLSSKDLSHDGEEQTETRRRMASVSRLAGGGRHQRQSGMTVGMPVPHR